MIGLCTPYKINNYGTKLQAYAVQEKIKELGYDCEIINFNRKSDLRLSRLFLRYCNIQFIHSKLDKKKSDNNIQNKDDIKKRNNAINSFDLNHYKLTPEIKGYKNLADYSKKYEALICGSDQIWLPSSINIPTSTLEFASKDIRKIAFAPSFGISEIPKNKINQYKKFLNNLDYISVREITGANLVKELVGKDAKNILDPTLTVNRKTWDELCEERKTKIDEKYIFCYFLGTNKEHRESVYNFAKEKGLKIVTMPHFKRYNECDETLTDIQLYDVTPCDFISLIRNAEYICTDSFHSTVFSILYHKNFYTFERFSSSDKMSANSRIHSLLGLLNMKDRILTSNNNYKITDKKINYDEVEKRLGELRKETDDYLKEALKGLKKK